MTEAEKRLAYYRSHILKEEDCFDFECQRCGGCCTARDEAVVINGVDLFHISKVLDVDINVAIPKYFNINLGPNSGLPILTLKERPDGKCIMMAEDGRCSIQSDKPIVCAIFPLGRMYSNECGFEYFTQPGDRCPGHGHAKHTLKEWLEQFHISEKDAEAAAWNELLTILAPISKLRKEEQYALVGYTGDIIYGFDRSRDFTEQLLQKKKLAEMLIASISEITKERRAAV